MGKWTIISQPSGHFQWSQLRLLNAGNVSSQPFSRLLGLCTGKVVFRVKFSKRRGRHIQGRGSGLGLIHAALV